jgi:cytochrome c
MKKLFFICISAAVIAACNSGGEGGETKTDSTAQPADTAASGPVASADTRGLELIGASDCTTCHAIDKKNIGPAYVDVANKYEATDAVIDTLVSKVIKGGQGVWGQVPMTPHPDLPEADAREMVKYILSLKGRK